MAAASGTAAASAGGEKPQMIQRRFVLGVQQDVKDGCQFIDENTVIWTAGKNVVVYNTQYQTQKFIPASDTCEGITALAVSANRRSLAVAEVSETPAIAIYDPQTRRRKRFLQVPEIGSREYVSLCFSADGRHLAAQGGFPEWNLVLWNVEKTKAVAMAPANDRTNPSQDRRLINQCSISPKDPTVICCSGNGIFKFFRYQDNQLRQLTSGLGKSEPMNYRAHVWLPPDDRIIVSTDNGDLLLVENFEYRHQLPLSPSDGISIDTLIAHGNKGFICGGDMGTISIYEKSEDKELFRRVKTHNIGSDRKDADSLVTTEETVRILGFSITPHATDECISILTSNRQLYILNLSQADYSKAEERVCEYVAQPFHAAAITGLDICIRKPLLVTCGKDRNVILWNYVTNTAEVTKRFTTEVLSVAIHPSGLHLLVGFPDKLRFMNIYGDDIREFRSFSIRSCTECRFSHGGQFFATMNTTIIHVYFTYTCELLGHLRGHGGKVKSIYFSQPDDTSLFSAGIDGAVYQFALDSFQKAGEHNCKSIPFNAVTCDEGMVWVSGNDRKIRQLQRDHMDQPAEEHDLRNCNALSLAQAHGLKLLFGGCEDGTVRVFNTFLAEKTFAERLHHEKTGEGGSREGKTEIMIESHTANAGGVTRVAVSFDESVVASVGEDGVLTLWDIVAPHRGQKKDVQFAEEILIDRKDLEERNREIHDLNEKVAELKQRAEHMQHRRELQHEEKLQQLKETVAEGSAKQKQLLDKLLGEKSEQAIRFTDMLGDMEEKHKQLLQRTEQDFNSKIKTLEEQLAKYEENIAIQIKQHDEERSAFEERARQDAAALARDHDRQLREAQEMIERLQSLKKANTGDAEEMTVAIEAETDYEIMELKEKYEAKLTAEQEQSSELKAENAVMLGKETQIKADLDAKDSQIKEKHLQQNGLQMQIYNQERDIEALKHELAERVDTINDKSKRIHDLQKKNEELGKFRFVLEYKITELKEQIAPRDEEIKTANEQYSKMEFEAGKYNRSNDELVLSIRGLKLKLDGQQREMDKLHRQLQEAEEFQAQLYTELTELHEEENPRRLKEKTKTLFYRHTAPTASSSSADVGASASASGSAKAGGRTDDAQRDYNRGRDYMERTVSGLKKKLIKDSETNRADRSRITGESVTLTKEINELRREKRTLLLQKRGVTAVAQQHEAQRELDMQKQEIARLRQRVGDLERQLHALGKSASTAGAATLA